MIARSSSSTATRCSAVLVGLLAFAVPSEAQGSGDFALPAMVPDDVFIVASTHSNPERAFLNEAWGEVWEEFEASGVIEDVVGLLESKMGEQEREHASRLFDRFSALAGAVDWTGMEQGETLFAERLMPGHGNNGAFSLGPPDIILMYRFDAEGVSKNYAALTALLSAGLDELHGVTGKEFVLQTAKHGEVELSSINFTEGIRQAPPVRISLGKRGDVLLLAIGEGLRDEVIGFLSGTNQEPSIASTTRYQRAFAALPDPEDGFEYFDAVNFVADLGRMRDAAFALVEKEAAPRGDGAESGQGGDTEAEMWLSVAKSLTNRVFETIGIVEAQATVHYTEGRATYSESASLLAANAKENPFYPVIEAGPEIEDFATYLPAETKTFVVQSGGDMNALYSFLEGSIAELGPVGEDLLGQWAALQQQLGFDVREDVIGWLGGTSVNATFDLDNQDAWISMMKVKDEAKAASYLEMGLTLGVEKLKSLTTEMPQLAMLSVQVREVEEEGLEGFRELRFMMSPEPVLCGVRDGWLMFASSPEAVNRTLKTSSGAHPNVRSNEELMAKALVPAGPVTNISYADHTNDSKEAAAALAGISMMGGMVSMAIPEQEARDVVIGLLGTLSNLSSVVETIDFYESSSSHTTFDGEIWHMRSVTNYVSQ